MFLLIIWSIWLATMLTFYFGYKLGQLEVKEPTVLPIPTKKPKRNKINKKAIEELEKEQERINTIAHNIEAYDGTPFGQKDIPE